MSKVIASWLSIWVFNFAEISVPLSRLYDIKSGHGQDWTSAGSNILSDETKFKIWKIAYKLVFIQWVRLKDKSMHKASEIRWKCDRILDSKDTVAHASWQSDNCVQKISWNRKKSARV